MKNCDIPLGIITVVCGRQSAIIAEWVAAVNCGDIVKMFSELSQKI